MIDLAMARKYLRLGYLSNYERIIECCRAIVERPRCSNDCGRGRRGDTRDPQVGQPLPVPRHVRLEAGQFAQGSDGLLMVVLMYGRFSQCVECGNKVVVFAYSQKDLGQPPQRRDLILVL